ncbi:MAG: response regulator transcription factor [Lachnospiraceae bacterium]|nr:response regulator transcription factor [Lachnospiraceae bacterium]
MLSIYICDDEEVWRKKIAKIADCFMFQTKLAMDSINGFANPEVLLNYRKEHFADQNIYFLDIDLGEGKMNGLELASKLRKLDERGYIVFITTYEEMMSQTFKYKVSALDFICKDRADLEKRIRECLDCVKDNILNSSEVKSSIFIKHDGDYERLLLDDVVYIEKVKNTHKIRIHKTTGFCEYTGSLAEIEEHLPGYFFKGNRGLVVNAKHVVKISCAHREIMLSNNMACKCSFGEIAKLLDERD